MRAYLFSEGGNNKVSYINRPDDHYHVEIVSLKRYL